MTTREGYNWTIKFPIGNYLIPKYVRHTRPESIKAFMEDRPEKTTKKKWRHWRDVVGFKCVKVILAEPDNLDTGSRV